MIKKEVKEDKKELLDQAEISLILDTYDDIFSDFDPRPFSQRSLSDDFLFEAKRRSKNDTNGLELKFLMPHDKRDLSAETIIKKRLKEHFKKHHLEQEQSRKKIRNKGLGFCFGGVILMLIATFILFKYPDSSMITHFLVVLLEPAGWFLFWEGLNLIVFHSKEKSPDLEFYSNMDKSSVNFVSY